MTFHRYTVWRCHRCGHEATIEHHPTRPANWTTVVIWPGDGTALREEVDICGGCSNELAELRKQHLKEEQQWLKSKS